MKKIIEKLKEIEEVKAIYLFGSHARGEVKAISDIDICVITGRDAARGVKNRILSLAWKDIDISILSDLPPVIKAKVFREGKLLFARDEDFLNDVRIEAMRQYLRVKPMIERFTKLYMEA